MKNQLVNRMKKLVAAVVAMSMLAGMSLVSNAGDPVDETIKSETDIRYELTTQADYEKYLGQNKAPEDLHNDAGYIFGGWFQKDGEKMKPLTALADVKDNTKVYAKYVPAQIFSVKCQNLYGTTADTTSTSVKVLAGVDSVNYQNVGFEIYAVSFKDKDHKTLGTVNKLADDIIAKDVYRTLKIGTNDPIPASDVFSSNDTTYVAAAWINNIAQANYGKVISIKPYWITLDGAKVYGLTKYAHVEDGYVTADGKRWVNIPVNVRDIENVKVAAGVMSMELDTANSSNKKDLDSIEVECGQLFGEMDFAIKSDNSVKMVGNLKEMKEDTHGDIIYANVRYQVEAGELEVIKGFNFTISNVDFADIAENQYTATEFPVWNVIY